MLLKPHKHLFATNIVIFFIIYIVQKLITIFCIIEQKACNNNDCSPRNPCNERCAGAAPRSTADNSIPQKEFPLMATSLRKIMRNFGNDDGCQKIFGDEHQRSRAHLNAAEFEVKLNPN